MGEKWVETHFSPTSNPFRDFRENPLFSQFKGVGNCFLKRALKQSRPIITALGFPKAKNAEDVRLPKHINA